MASIFYPLKYRNPPNEGSVTFHASLFQSAKWFGIEFKNYVEENAGRNQTIAAAQELLYQVTGSHLLSRQIIEQFLTFEQLYFAYPSTMSEAGEWTPGEIITKMEELNLIRRSIVDAAKTHKPKCDYWQATKAVAEKIGIFPILCFRDT